MLDGGVHSFFQGGCKGVLDLVGVIKGVANRISSLYLNTNLKYYNYFIDL